MREVGFGEAWVLWASGNEIRAYVLWGWPILWWGRIGEVCQIVGGFAVVLELVGTARLESFAGSLRGLAGPKSVLNFVDALFAWLLALSHYIRAQSKRSRGQGSYSLKGAVRGSAFGSPVASVLNALVSLWLVGLFLVEMRPLSTGITVIVGSVAVALVAFTVVTPILLLLAAAAVVALAVPAAVLVIQPVAWAMTRRQAAAFVQVASLALLTVGTTLELLAD